MSITRGANISAALLIAACCHLTPALAEPLACDDGIKTAFHGLMPTRPLSPSDW